MKHIQLDFSDFLISIQIDELEKDREELHEIARHDKNHIHELSVQNKEYELSDKNLKDQVNVSCLSIVNDVWKKFLQIGAESASRIMPPKYLKHSQILCR